MSNNGLPLYRYRKAKPAPERYRDRQYVMLREAWRASHPKATPREYEDAMKHIARELKL